MKGIEFVLAPDGTKKAVVIDLTENAELWEDFYDAALAEERSKEPRESVAEVRRHLDALPEKE